MMSIPRGVTGSGRFDRAWMLNPAYPVKILLNDLDVVQSHDSLHGNQIDLKFKTRFDLLDKSFFNRFNIKSDFLMLEDCTILTVKSQMEDGHKIYVAYARATRMLILDSVKHARQVVENIAPTSNTIRPGKSELEVLIQRHGEELGDWIG